ncbi:MDR family MFS transporter [Actinoallomurus sp. NPDC050550]|uniref:MDR family MFS transporter n=1 Tax=Actinoallomurus sp. NPDC050550 TaxID=3154937 RepID=UPI0033F6B8ED
MLIQRAPVNGTKTTVAAEARAARPEPLDPALLRMGAVLILGAILAGLDATIVNVGIDAIARDLHGGLSAVQWVSTGYLLAISMVMPLSGWMTDRFGGTRMWMISVGLFVAGSALCGLAWSTSALIAFRVLQGIGGGMMQPIGQSIMAQAAGPSRIGRVMSILIIPVSFAPVIGPVLGGLIVADLDWRWMFYVNLPIGAIALLLASRVLPKDTPHTATRAPLDVLGLALLSPGLAALVYGFAAAGGAGGFGTGRVVAALTGAAALLTAYGAHALRRRVTPLVDLRLFARRGFAAATSNSFLLGASLYSSMLLLPLYDQQARHASAIEAGFFLAPQALGTALASFFAGRLSDRIGARGVVLAGIGLALTGTVVFTRLGTDPAGPLLILSLLVRGVGIGTIMAPGMAAVYGSVERHEAPRAAGALNVVNRVGGSIGTAVFALILQSRLGHHPANPAAAYGDTFAWALGLTALSIIPALFFSAKPRTPASREERT